MLGRLVASGGVHYITPSYRVLVEALGQPGKGDDGKTLAQWDVNTPHGWAEVYDFKDSAKTPEDVETWHAQAGSKEALEYVFMAIKDAATRLGEAPGLGES